MEIIIGVPEGTLESIVLKCPDLTWNQVFGEADRLSRQGQVFLKKKGAGAYTVTPRTPVVAAKSALHIH